MNHLALAKPVMLLVFGFFLTLRILKMKRPSAKSPTVNHSPEPQSRIFSTITDDQAGHSANLVLERGGGEYAPIPLPADSQERVFITHRPPNPGAIDPWPHSGEVRYGLKYSIFGWNPRKKW